MSIHRSFAQISRSWSAHPLFGLCLVALTVAAAMIASQRVEDRWVATSALTLTATYPDNGIQQTLDKRARAIERLLQFDPSLPRPSARARRPSRNVEVTVEAGSPKLLSFLVNVYAAELVAWELGPEQRAIQRRYRRMLEKADNAAPDDPRIPQLVTQLRTLEALKVNDSQYRKSRGPKHVDGPAPARAAALALVFGLLVATTFTTALRWLDESGKRYVRN